MPTSNLFSAVPNLSQGEQFETLLRHRNVVIERIVSTSDIEPQLYVQEQDEWVALLQGRAQIEMDETEIELNAGDTLFIPTQTPHKVLSTSANPQCIWLTVHIFSEPKAEG